MVHGRHADLVAEADAFTVSGEGRVLMHAPEQRSGASQPGPRPPAMPAPPVASAAPLPAGGSQRASLEFDDTFDDTFSGGENLLAGAISGLIAETVMHPFDTVSHRAKVHPSSQYGSFAGAFRLIYHQGEAGGRAGGRVGRGGGGGREGV
jgi:hypothetical protein